MIPSEISNFTKRVFKISAVLIMISAFIIVTTGYVSSKINYDIKVLNAFLIETEDLGTNFEQSLQLYTEGTELAITHINSLRPRQESDYIGFISEVETIGENMGLELSLRSITMGEQETSTKGNTLDYQLSFYGAENDVTEFLKKLEDLNYYIKVSHIEFADLDYLEDNSSKLSQNIKIKIRLYVN